MLDGLVSVQKTKSYESIVRQLSALIADGRLAPGQKLPAERVMVKQLGVGRTTFREALRVLEVLGMLETRAGEGTFVTNGRRPLIPNDIIEGMLRESSSVIEVYEVRVSLEPQIAFLAAERATEEQLQALDASFARLSSLVDDLPEFGTEDVRFHGLIAEMAGNELLREFERFILNMITPHLMESLYMPRRTRSTLEEHRAIYEAIRSRDSLRAKAAVVEHLRIAQERTLSRYRDRVLTQDAEQDSGAPARGS